MRLLHSAFVLASCFALAAPAAGQLRAHRLDNGTVTVLASEAAGGRLLSFALAGRPNFLLVDEGAGNPDAVSVSPFSNNVPYLGHEVWVGPQKDWWTEQALNPERARSKAQWPPDPWLSLAPYALVQRTPSEVVVDSPPSLVTGIQLRKRYALVTGRPNSLQLDVRATNRRNKPVARDIWFNTRVRAEARVYVPIQDEEKLRVNPFPGTSIAPPVYSIEQGLFSFELAAPPAGKTIRRGKEFMQPTAGWIAAFDHDQAFIIQFALQPESLIHPEQGQVELYLDYQPENPAASLMELEVHAPYKTLQPNEEMQAHEVWTILAYTGDFTSEAHIAFLKRQAASLGLEGL